MTEQELQARVNEARALQTHSKPRITRENRGNGHLSARVKRQFRQADKNAAKPKIMNFRQEPRYAFPANLGNARNPLIFGKIPVRYQVIEKWENEQTLHNAGLANTNKTKYLERIRSMYFRFNR
jgi:hypothetical protein